MTQSLEFSTEITNHKYLHIISHFANAKASTRGINVCLEISNESAIKIKWLRKCESLKISLTDKTVLLLNIHHVYFALSNPLCPNGIPWAWKNFSGRRNMKHFFAAAVNVGNTHRNSIMVVIYWVFFLAYLIWGVLKLPRAFSLPHVQFWINFITHTAMPTPLINSGSPSRTSKIVCWLCIKIPHQPSPSVLNLYFL